MSIDLMEDGKPVDFAFRGDYISLHFNEMAKVMSKQRVRGAISILNCFLILLICGKTTIGNPQSENTVIDKMNLGSSLRKEGKFYPAIAAFDEALKMAGRLKDGRNQLNCLMQLGILHWNIGQVEESASIYRRALALSQKIGSKDIETECSGYVQIYESYLLGKKTRDSGLYKESIDHFSAAISLSRKMESPEHELKCLRQMSLIYFQTEAYSEFLSLNKMGLGMARKLGHRREKGRFINNIGLSNLIVCDYSKALVLFKEALKIAQGTSNNEQDLSTCLNNIGLTYYYLGQFEKALLYLEKALEIDSRLNDEVGICIDLNNIGIAYSRKGRGLKNKRDLLISLDYYFKSLDFAAKTNNKRSKIDTLNNIGLIYGTLNYYFAAKRYFQQAIHELNQIDYAYEACNVHCNMGYALLGLGEHHKSIEHFKQALEIAGEIGRHDILWEAYDGLGKSMERIGRKEAALACYRNAISTINQMRSRLVLDDFRTVFTRDKIRAYESLINLLFSLRDNKIKNRYDLEILQVIERSKARSFLEELSQGKWTALDPDTAIKKSDQKSLLDKISKTISRLTKPGLDEAQRKKLLARLETEEEEYTNFLNRIGTQRMEDSRQVFPDIVTIDRIRGQCLDKKTAIIEYYLGDRQSIGLFLDEKQLVLKALSPRTEIENSLRAYLKILSEPPDGIFMGIPAAQRIYRELLSPFENYISPAIVHLVIVPDGILHYLPFETLVKNNAGNSGPKYLVELYDISYAPSVSSLSHLMGKKRPRKFAKALLAVGGPVYPSRDIGKSGPEEKQGDVLREIFLKDGFELSPLPHSRKEIGRVVRCFPKDEVDVLLGSQAKEESLKSRSLETYQILHFACHGFLDEKTPMRSALVLTLDDDFEEDGFLQAREISSLNLSADLVVLSACQTGKGRLENAEGVLGLPRAFFYAGARSTISSLWKISDKSTSEIMPSFYRHLTRNKNKARALRLAKLEKLRSAQSHPFYWAAFVLNGDYTWEAGHQAAISSK